MVVNEVDRPVIPEPLGQNTGIVGDGVDRIPDGVYSGGLLASGGGWVFRQRSWTPVPLALVLVFVRWHSTHLFALFIAGEAVVAIGLAIRFWGVSHIGGISRTRAARLGPLTSTGPYLLVRNPLYVGNFLMWTGFVLASQLVWMLPVAWIVFAVQYGAIVRFEEGALVRHFGAAYVDYARRVPRWALRVSRLGAALRTPRLHGWRAVAFSERGGLIAAAVMSILLFAKFRWA